MREWVIYVLVMAVIFVLFFRDRAIVGALAGLLVSGPLYLLLGAVLAKFGYQRSSIKDMRKARATAAAESTEPSADAPRPRPAPTRRTSGDPSKTASSNRPRRKR
jgi:hypothetical protein